MRKNVVIGALGLLALSSGGAEAVPSNHYPGSICSQVGGGPQYECLLTVAVNPASANQADYSINMYIQSTRYRNCHHYATNANRGPLHHIWVQRWNNDATRFSAVDDWGLLGLAVAGLNADRKLYCDSEAPIKPPNSMDIEYRQQPNLDRSTSGI